MPYASLACDMTSASEVAVAAWAALQVLYAFAFAFIMGYRRRLSERKGHIFTGSSKMAVSAHAQWKYGS